MKDLKAEAGETREGKKTGCTPEQSAPSLKRRHGLRRRGGGWRIQSGFGCGDCWRGTIPYRSGTGADKFCDLHTRAYAGAGLNLLFTNAASSQQLAGPFTTLSIKVGGSIANLGVQFSTGGGIWQLSVTPPVVRYWVGVCRIGSDDQHGSCLTRSATEVEYVGSEGGSSFLAFRSSSYGGSRIVS